MGVMEYTEYHGNADSDSLRRKVNELNETVRQNNELIRRLMKAEPGSGKDDDSSRIKED